MTYQDPDPPQEAQVSEPDPTALVRKARNPLTETISIPFQNNVNFGVGPGNDIQNALNIQPILPISIGDWSLVARPIIPVIHQPEFIPGRGTTEGLGDVRLWLFLSPAGAGGFRWGAGPSFLFPTATEKNLGTQKYSAGPTAVAVAVDGPWRAGEQRLVVLRHEPPGRREPAFRPTLRAVHDRRRLVRDLRPGHHGELGSPGRPALDRADRGRHRGRVFRLGGVPFNIHIAAYENVEHPRLGVGEPKPPGPEAMPVRNQDVTEAVAQLDATTKHLTELIQALDHTLSTADLARLTAQVTPVVQRAEAGGKQVVDYVFWKGCLLVGVVLLAALIYRFLAHRLGKPPAK